MSSLYPYIKWMHAALFSPLKWRHKVCIHCIDKRNIRPFDFSKDRRSHRLACTCTVVLHTLHDAHILIQTWCCSSYCKGIDRESEFTYMHATSAMNTNKAVHFPEKRTAARPGAGASLVSFISWRKSSIIYWERESAAVYVCVMSEPSLKTIRTTTDNFTMLDAHVEQKIIISACFLRVRVRVFGKSRRFYLDVCTKLMWCYYVFGTEPCINVCMDFLLSSLFMLFLSKHKQFNINMRCNILNETKK